MPLPLFAKARTTHPEAVDWAKRAGDNQGTISTQVLRAVSDFCEAADATGPGAFRSAMYRLNLFCGGNLSGALVPLYRGPTFGGTTFGGTTDTNVNFVSGDFTETGVNGGLKGNGVNKYLRTTTVTASIPSLLSSHASVSGKQLETSGDVVLFGAWNGGNDFSRFQLDAYRSASSGRSVRIGPLGAVLSSPSSVESHLIGTRTSATNLSLYSSGSLVATETTSRTPISLAGVGPYVFGLNPNNAAATSLSAALLTMYSMGSGLTAIQAGAFSAAVASFNAALGR
jgi:hypothetical protein